MMKFRLTRQAENQLDEILTWSEVNFHEAGRDRYATLLLQAMRDLAEEPQRQGVEWVRAEGTRMALYHAWHSRNNVSDRSARVHEPRHLVVFRLSEDGVLEVLGFVHDSMLRARALRRLIRANKPDAD